MPIPTPACHWRARMRRPRRLLALVASAALTAAGCGSIPAPGRGQQLTHVSVAVVPITDAAPFMLALQRGYFTRAGLHVTYEITPQSTAAAADLVHGSVNVIAAANYVSFLAAQARGTLNIRILAANSQCGTSTNEVLTLPRSAIRSPADLAGKTIAVNVDPNIQTLTITRILQANGVSTARVRFVVIPFKDMPAALAARQVDAISEVEPFVTSTENSLGAQAIIDQCTGPTAGIPLGGYLTSAAWARAHPAAARAFAHAVEQGQALAATSRTAVEKILPTYMTVTKNTAALVNLNTFPTSASPAQLQRVANLMAEGGMLTKPLNVRPLIFR